MDIMKPLYGTYKQELSISVIQCANENIWSTAKHLSDEKQGMSQTEQKMMLEMACLLSLEDLKKIHWGLSATKVL